MNRTLTLCLLLSIIAHLLLSMSYAHWPQDQVLVSVEYREGPSASAARKHIKSPGPKEVSAAQTPVAGESPVLGAALGLPTTYPKLSRILHEEGEVLIRSSDLAILKSSGHPRLDESARASVRAGKGLLRPNDTQIRFIFKLRDDH